MKPWPSTLFWYISIHILKVSSNQFLKWINHDKLCDSVTSKTSLQAIEMPMLLGVPTRGTHGFFASDTWWKNHQDNWLVDLVAQRSKFDRAICSLITPALPDCINIAIKPWLKTPNLGPPIVLTGKFPQNHRKTNLRGPTVWVTEPTGSSGLWAGLLAIWCFSLAII